MILVTGGAGFKSCLVTETLLDRGHAVTVLDTMEYGEGPAIALQRRGADIVRGSITDAALTAAQVRRHDAVIHLAGVVGFPLCDLDPARAEEFGKTLERLRKATGMSRGDLAQRATLARNTIGNIDHEPQFFHSAFAGAVPGDVLLFDADYAFTTSGNKIGRAHV